MKNIEIEYQGKENMLNEIFEKKILQNGMTYKGYTKSIIEEVGNTKPEILNEHDLELFEYKKLNIQRSARIEKIYDVSDELKSEIQNIKDKQIWMVITEAWCGDSAQNLPYIAKMASLNFNIELKIILRDSNLDVMDLYLTNGARSIPKLVALDENGNELFTWGPRPKAAQDLMKQWKDEGIVKPELYEKLHLWYGRNRGREIESEFLKIISMMNQVQV